MWLYSSPLEALVVVVITGTDRTVISYININSLVIYNIPFPQVLKSLNVERFHIRYALTSIINKTSINVPKCVSIRLYVCTYLDVYTSLEFQIHVQVM